jgi:hypothetical protein
VAGEDGGDELGSVAAAEVLGVNRSTLRDIPIETLPYREIGTGRGRGLTRRYRRSDLEALRDARAARAAGLPSRVEFLEQRLAYLDELEQRVAELEAWRDAQMPPPVQGELAGE